MLEMTVVITFQIAFLKISTLHKNSFYYCFTNRLVSIVLSEDIRTRYTPELH